MLHLVYQTYNDVPILLAAFMLRDDAVAFQQSSEFRQDCTIKAVHGVDKGWFELKRSCYDT